MFSVLLLLTGCKHVHSPNGECETLVVVDQTKIPNYDNWMEKNNAYIANVPLQKSTGESSCTEQKIYIESSSISQVKYPEWLKANGHYICYNETYKYIECVHSIDTTTCVISKKLRDKLTLAQIKAEIRRKGGDFEEENYDKYTSLSFDANKKLVISVVSRFDATTICYSIPLLRSVVAKYNLTDSSIFEFMQADMSTYRTIIFKVQDRTGINNYYDFSQIPP